MTAGIESSRACHRVRIGALAVDLLPGGGAHLPEHSALVVADLHLEKASAFAARGAMLPPYETLDTLTRLARIVGDVAPRTLILLGDSFHSAAHGIERGSAAFEAIAEIAGRAEIIWIAGNHDPVLPAALPGRSLPGLDIGDVRLRHEAAEDGLREIVGHHHPSAVLMTRAGRQRRKCFLVSPARLMLPAFGELTGGLDARSRILRALFPDSSTKAVLINGDVLFPVPVSTLA